MRASNGLDAGITRQAMRAVEDSGARFLQKIVALRYGSNRSYRCSQHEGGGSEREGHGPVFSLSVQGLVEIGENVFDRLYADRNSQEVIVDTHARAMFGR